MEIKLARKYRPKQLDDMVGQKHIVATLKQASINKMFAQSYLFSGIRGSGKTSVARIIANLITCESPENGKTCGKCNSCLNVPIGGSMDVRELDGASNNSVDEARALKEAAYYPPNELNKKIYIIDECHMLSTAANNALLKVVEEPPPYLVFIFCTTEPKKILPTILSRCQRFNFTRIPSKDIASRLKLIADQEKIDISNEALFVLAKIARGSLRDAIVALEQIGTVGVGKKISEENVQKYFGSIDRKIIFDIVKAIKNNNVALLFDQVNDLTMASVDPKAIMFDISEIFRNIMVIKAQEGNTKLVDLPDSEIEELKKLSDDFRTSQLMKLSHVFTDIERKLEYNINERWIMEATLINCVAILRKSLDQ